MTQGIEGNPTSSIESLSPQSIFFDAIGHKFTVAYFDTDTDPYNLYIDYEDDPITGARIGTILLAVNYDQHSRHEGETLWISIPFQKEGDVWDAITSLENQNNPDRFAIITHKSGDKKFAFRITDTEIKPHRENDQFGTHSRFMALPYLEQTTEKVSTTYHLFAIKPKSVPDN